MPANIFSVRFFIEPSGKDKYDVFLGIKSPGIHVGRIRTNLEESLSIEYEHLINDRECFYIHKGEGSDYFTSNNLKAGAQIILPSYHVSGGWTRAGWIQIWNPMLKVWNEDGAYKTRWHR